MRERFFVELAPGYVRLRHQLGYRTTFGRRRLGMFEEMIVQAMEQADLAGEPLEIGPPEDSDDYLELVAAEEAARREAEEEFFASLNPWEAVEYLEARDIEAAKKAAEARLGRGAKGISERSRREMWRWVLSLPFEMLGERPLWITSPTPATGGAGCRTGRPWSGTAARLEKPGTGASGNGQSGSGPRGSNSPKAALICIC